MGRQNESNLGETPKLIDSELQKEQHLYRKHLHFRLFKDRPRMLIFLIAFVSFHLE
jgi:hypothetical protein